MENKTIDQDGAPVEPLSEAALDEMNVFGAASAGFVVPPPKKLNADLTPRQLAFIMCYLELGSPRQAYIAAYDVVVTEDNKHQIGFRASNLMKLPKVKRHIEKAILEATESGGVSVMSLSRELEEARSVALDNRQASAAVAATMGKAKIHGLDKPEPASDDSKDVVIFNTTYEDAPAGKQVLSGPVEKQTQVPSAAGAPGSGDPE